MKKQTKADKAFIEKLKTLNISTSKVMEDGQETHKHTCLGCGGPIDVQVLGHGLVVKITHGEPPEQTKPHRRKKQHAAAPMEEQSFAE